MTVIEIVMPKIGLNMEEGTIVDWIKKEGDEVKRGDVLFVLETEKITAESESPYDGKLVKILIQEGKRVPVKTPVALLEAAEGSIPLDKKEKIEDKLSSALEPHLVSSQLAISTSPRSYLASPKAKFYARQYGIDLVQVASQVGGIIKHKHLIAFTQSSQPLSKPVATPVAKRMAQEAGIDLSTVTGSGVAGKITRQDIEDILKKQTEQRTPALEKKASPLKGIRAVIAERMLSSSQNTASVTLHSEADITNIVNFRKRLKEIGSNIIPSYNAIFISLAAKALEGYPTMNSLSDSETIISSDEINVGLAVDHVDGLRVVVVKHANQKTLSRIQADLEELIGRVRANSSTLDDLSGGTFTITNLGAYGIDYFTPIINPPQTGILGVGRITEKLVIKDGKIAQRNMITLSLTFDHRIIDGAPAAQFLQMIVTQIENFKETM